MAAIESTKLLCKMLYVLKRLSDESLFGKLCHGNCEKFNNAHLPLFLSIDDDGVSNSKLALKLNVSKQAASKVIKDLEEQNLVRTEKSAEDARSSIISLTERGVELKKHIKSQVMELEGQYAKLLGGKNYAIAMESMQKMIDFHEAQLKHVYN